MTVTESKNGLPSAFTWRRQRFGPLTVEDEWLYAEPWWQKGVGARAFYRVSTTAGERFDLCRRADGSWRLYRVFD